MKLLNDLKKLGFNNVKIDKFEEYPDISDQIDKIIEFSDK